MIYILYSNDYEVFLGGNYYPEEVVLIEQTDILLKTCDEINIPITLFCDVMFLWRYRELGFLEIVEKIERQLKSSVKNGHDVQAHVHPHWEDVEVRNLEKGGVAYNFDLNKFLLGNRFFQGGEYLEKYCIELFVKIINYLEELLKPDNPEYRCIAYRAGGYGLQPNEKEIIHALVKAGILIDSSLVPGLRLDSNVNRINFLEVPYEANYRLSPDSGINYAATDGIYEIPIAALRGGAARWPLICAFIKNFIRYINFHKSITHTSLGFSIQATQFKQKRDNIIKRALADLGRIWKGWWMLEICSNDTLMYDAARYYIDMYYRDIDIFFAVSCHSKSITPVEMTALRKFHRKLIKRYGDEIKAISFQEAYTLIGEK